MKLKIGDKVYLQKYEIAYIVHNPNGVPGSILDETFSGDSSDFFVMNSPQDGYRFECAFEDSKNVAWLMEQGWLVDFDVFYKMELDELEDLFGRLSAELRTEIEEFNAKDKAYREKNYSEKVEFFDRFWHKIVSLEKLIEFRKGKIEFVFPSEYRSAEVTAIPTKNASTNTNKKPGFFARLFSRSSAQ